LQRIDLPLHLIGLGILRERRRRHEDRRENCAGQQQSGALFDDHHPLLFWPKREGEDKSIAAGEIGQRPISLVQ
jgi:hypothetical protein